MLWQLVSGPNPETNTSTIKRIDMRLAVNGMTLCIDALCGLALAPRGPAYTFVRVMQGLHGDGIQVRAFAPLSRWPRGELGFEFHSGGTGFHSIDSRVPFARIRWPLNKRSFAALGPLLQQRAEAKFLNDKAASPDRIALTWGPVSIETTRELHRRGTPIIREKFNCAKRVARDILTDAYAQLGAAGQVAIRDEDIEIEEEELRLASAVFSPSPMVAESLRQVGVPEERIIDTSYGWDPARFAGTERALEPIDGVTLVFGGYVCVRKGAATLLRAWEQANIRGRLVLVGAIEPLIAEKMGHILARPDVVHVPFTPRVGDYFRAADWFIFPTLEEGSPLVSYEAAGCGLPLLVTPMGAGSFARDGVEGHVLDSQDPGEWARLIKSLPDRKAEREEMGLRARARADDYTYELVGARRREALLARFSLERASGGLAA